MVPFIGTTNLIDNYENKRRNRQALAALLHKKRNLEDFGVYSVD